MSDFLDSFLREYKQERRAKKRRRIYKTKEELFLNDPPSNKCIECQYNRQVCDGNPYSNEPCSKCSVSVSKRDCYYNPLLYKESPGTI